MITIKLTPQSKVALKTPTLMQDQFKKGLRIGAYISGKEMVKFLKDEMTKKGRSGRKYSIYKGLGGRLLKKPRAHIASSPSEYPAVISGNFRKSIDFKVHGYSRLEFGSGSQGLAKNYAKALELGTSKMAARAPLGKTVLFFGNKVKDILTKEVNKAMKIK